MEMELRNISLTFCLIGLALFPHTGAKDSFPEKVSYHERVGTVIAVLAPSPNIQSTIVVFPTTTAAHAPSPTHSQDSPQAFLNVHNAARAAVGVQPMTWDNSVAVYAIDYANQRSNDCKLLHSGGPYGENLAMSTGNLSATDAVEMWIDEKTDYDLKSNTCASGHTCGHYTQVIWATSTRLGCAKVGCGHGGTFVVCNYDPPGNFVGERPTDWNQSIIGVVAPSPDSAPHFFPSKERKDMKGLVVGVVVGAWALILGLGFIWFISRRKRHKDNKLDDHINDVFFAESRAALVAWVWDSYGKKRLLDVADEKLCLDFDTKQMECLLMIGLWCVHPDHNLRPSIRQAIQVLNFEASLPNLP
ncbi:hypothetical protein QUC31_015073, partial [Theobroma cacao]